MKKATISDGEKVIHILQDEIRRSYEARYDHRLHAMLLVAQGLSCRNVSELLGDSPQSVAYWVSRFESEGLSGLVGPIGLEDLAGEPVALPARVIGVLDRQGGERGRLAAPAVPVPLREGGGCGRGRNFRGKPRGQATGVRRRRDNVAAQDACAGVPAAR